MAKQMHHKPGEWFSEGLKIIERNGRNLLRLVNQMLDLSKLETGKLPVKLIQTDVVAFLKYLLESFHSLAATKNIRLSFQSDLRELYMDIDPEKLQEIVSNLLMNAIKFTPEKGVVNIDVDLAKTETPPNLILHISDTGIGIEPEFLPNIFDRFYQVNGKDSRKAGGVGIGLALTKELVNLLKGTITVKSTVGTGSIFTISLPVRQKAPLSSFDIEREESKLSGSGELIPIDSATENGNRPIVLIVEDNKDVITYLRSILAPNYILEEATNGREGIQKAIEIIPDFIISDVMMPEIDGFELCATLKNDERTSHIPIILLTAKADVDSRIEGLNCGADAYLAKPFEQKELLIRMKNLILLRKRLQDRYRNSGTPSGSAITNQEKKEDLFIKKVRDVLEAHLDDDAFGIPELCKQLGISRAQLYRKFKALTGQPIGQYFKTMRLEKGKELLLSTDLHVAEVAYRVGFKDPSYFTKLFKTEYGVNPKEIRS